jgi:hypothetical protein
MEVTFMSWYFPQLSSWRDVGVIFSLDHTSIGCHDAVGPARIQLAFSCFLPV